MYGGLATSWGCKSEWLGAVVESTGIADMVTLDLKWLVWSATVQPESLSRFGGGFWDTVSVWGLFGKLRDGFLPDYGIRFPLHAPTGKCVPEFGLEMGWRFRLLVKRPPELLLWRPFSQLQMNALVVPG